jgi:hypothetical protein
LPSKNEALSSNPITAQKKKKEYIPFLTSKESELPEKFTDSKRG